MRNLYTARRISSYTGSAERNVHTRLLRVWVNSNGFTDFDQVLDEGVK